MPPANQQGSKAGLVTALVIFVVFFVVSTVFAIYWGVEYTNELQVNKNATAKVAKFVSPTSSALSDLASLVKTSNQTVIDAIENQRDGLSQKMTGTVTDADAANTAADSAIAEAQKKVNDLKLTVAIPPGNLVGTVQALTSQLASLSDAASKAQQAQADAEAATAKAKADADAQAKSDQAQIDAANKQYADLKATEAQNEQDQHDKITSLQKSSTDQLGVYSRAIADQQTAMASLNQKLSKSEKENKALKDRLAHFRIDVKESVVQQEDGKVVRIADSNTVFIDIGHNQGVTPGLTFEVYDPSKGIPPLGDGQREDDLPIGLASLEVTHVLSDSSECRVVRTTPGEAVVPGDAIMNLVFDPHTKFKFVVYGDFDLNQTGTATAADAEVIKRLVSQWGGQIQPSDQLNTDTDFLVLGTEPVVTELSDDDKGNAEAVKKHDDAQAAYDAYETIRAKAVEFGIPIMNQNRFLYYTGYYDLAKQ